jgi:methylmalonyl-CoA mutase
MEEKIKLVQEVRNSVDEFAEREGRRPRIMLANFGFEENDHDITETATALADMGFDVDMEPWGRTYIDVAQDALDNDVHVIGINSLKKEYKSLVVKLLEELASYDREDIMLVISGHIEAHNIKEMYGLGVSVVLVDNYYEKFAKEILSELETILF